MLRRYFYIVCRAVGAGVAETVQPRHADRGRASVCVCVFVCVCVCVGGACGGGRGLFLVAFLHGGASFVREDLPANCSGAAAAVGRRCTCARIATGRLRSPSHWPSDPRALAMRRGAGHGGQVWQRQPQQTAPAG